MLRVNYKIVFGTLTVESPRFKTTEDGQQYVRDENGNFIREGVKRFKVNICSANALCAFITKFVEDGVKYNHLWSFFADKGHAQRCIKNGWLEDSGGGKVVSARLNVAYQESRTLLPILCRGGIKVTAFYKEPPAEKEKKVTIKVTKH